MTKKRKSCKICLGAIAAGNSPLRLQVVMAEFSR
jgi:hypothetical protein